MTAAAPGAEPPYLTLSGITKRFGKFTALSGIALCVERGGLMTFLGPSGCGKTTLLRIIAGLETQDEGTIVQDGREISRLPAMQRDYGIVFQSYALFPNLTIFANSPLRCCQWWRCFCFCQPGCNNVQNGMPK